MINKSFEKYFHKKAVLVPWKFHPIPKLNKFKFIVVIPSYNEGDLILATINSIAKQKSIQLKQVLVVVVINNSDLDKRDIIENNHLTKSSILKNKFQFEISIIDAFDNYPLPQKFAGVGFARKIGFDLSLTFADSKTIFVALDADTLISNNYFEILEKHFNSDGFDCLIPGIKHQKAENKIEEDAIRQYEKFLFSTANELRNAGSPYGFVTMGSAMAFTKSCYIKAGGMPRKKATEDFYFLQEIVKTSSVKTIPIKLVFPSSRISDRVYLGTGFRMLEASKGKNLSDLFYSNSSFKILKKWLNIGQNGFSNSITEILNEANKINFNLPIFLEKNNIHKIWEGLQKSSKNEKQFRHQFHCWFDGLKTHRLLKYFSTVPSSSLQQKNTEQEQ